MNTFNIVKASLAIQTEVAALELQSREMVERNMTLRKALATIKTNLERGVKQPQNLAKAVYDSIDLARSLTPYTEMSTGITKIDPPMTNEEKTLVP